MDNKALNSLIFYINKEKKAILLLLGISMISSGIVVIQPLLMQKLIDSALLSKNIDTFYNLVLIIIVVSLFSIALSIVLQYSYTKLSVKILYNLRLDIFEKIFSNNKLFFQKYPIGDLLSRLEGDISELQRFGVDSIFALLGTILGLIGAIIIMFYYDVTLALFALILFPIEFFLLKPMYTKMHDVTKELRQSGAIVGSFIIESLRYVSFLKNFSGIENRKNLLYSLQNKNKSIILKQQIVQIKFTQIPVLISLVARFSLIIFGGLKVIRGDISIGELIAFLSYFTMVLAPVHTFLGILNNIPKLKVSINRLDEVLPNIEKQTKIKIPEKVVKIELLDVSFSYENSPILLKNIYLKIRPKEKIVLTGSNGIGKSTLIGLLLKELTIKKGEILFNGINIDAIDTQKYIGLVEQNPVILSMSLKENLLIANRDAKDEKLLEVLEKVGLSLWLKNQESGLETVLSEDGANLSLGQKQRIAIARIILKNPPIVIMDEPTSSLDKEFVEVIDELIDQNFKESTKIIISHHFCFKNAKYLKIEDKRIIELKNE